jgi:ankyrin repeat domain-containing protein 50
MKAKKRPFKLFQRKQSTAKPDKGTDAASPTCFWPFDLLAKDEPSARIFTYGYDSSISHFFGGPASKSTLMDHGAGLLQAIASRREQCRGRPLIFVAHSLGGLVVKQVGAHNLEDWSESSITHEDSLPRFFNSSNVASKNDFDQRDIIKSTTAILFFGTPHRGSDWGDTLVAYEQKVRAEVRRHIARAAEPYNTSRNQQ